jgi:hypothetical protein
MMVIQKLLGISEVKMRYFSYDELVEPGEGTSLSEWSTDHKINWVSRYYKLIISRPTGGVNNYPFNTLISCKASARKIGKPGDRIIIYEIFEDEQNTLYDYIMEDWKVDG